jgi:hypothetical protein
MSARTYAALAMIVTLLGFVVGTYIFCQVAGISLLTYIAASAAAALAVLASIGLGLFFNYKARTTLYEVTQ